MDGDGSRWNLSNQDLSDSFDSSLILNSQPEHGNEGNSTEWVCDVNGDSSLQPFVNQDETVRLDSNPDLNLVPPGIIGAEYLLLKEAHSMWTTSKPESLQRDPYHDRPIDPKSTREPGRESFNIMVVGEAGLGKTTLLKSFFKSFRDEDATSALFMRKETQNVIETRRKLENATTRRAEVERELYAAREAEQYILAERKKGEIHGLWSKINQLEEELKDLSKADEDRRKELLDLREKARALRTDMMQADGVLDFTLAAEKKVEAETVQADFEELKAALHEMRRDPQTGTACGFDEEEAVVPSNSRIASATVRVSRFDPFSITVGKNELLVTLIDTPGYGDNTNTVESFEVITDYVESCFQKQLLAETSTSERDYNQLLKGDPLVHCCLYFIAPHRLKYIDLAFMRRLHKWVNIVPIIAKSDTMTTKEKDEFKEHVRKTLEDEEIELYAFDQDIIQKMEQQDNQVYKPPWAVIGSTEAIRDAGFNVYLRKYPWGNALSSEPSHSDLPALRNLIMWSGQWQEMRDKSRKKYEQWRVSQSVASRLVRSAARSIDRQVSKVKQASGARLPWVILLLVLVPLALAAQMWVASTSSSASQTAKLTPRLDQMAADNDAFMALQAAADFSAAVQAYEKHIAVLSHQMNGAQDAGETSAKTAQEKREALANSLKIAKQQILSLDSDLENTGAKKLEAEVKPLPNNKRGASYTWSSLLVLLIPAATIPLAVVRWDQNRRHRKTQQLATRDVTLL